MGQYTKEMHEAYRKEQDEKAAKEEQEEAKKQGYAQVLWTDARDHAAIEEVGTMNVFVQIGDQIATQGHNVECDR